MLLTFVNSLEPDQGTDGIHEIIFWKGFWKKSVADNIKA